MTDVNNMCTQKITCLFFCQSTSMAESIQSGSGLHYCLLYLVHCKFQILEGRIKASPLPELGIWRVFSVFLSHLQASEGPLVHLLLRMAFLNLLSLTRQTVVLYLLGTAWWLSLHFSALSATAGLACWALEGTFPMLLPSRGHASPLGKTERAGAFLLCIFP